MKSVLKMVSGLAALVAEEIVRLQEAEGSLKEAHMKKALMAVSGWMARKNEERRQAAEEMLRLKEEKEAAEEERRVAQNKGNEATEAVKRIMSSWGMVLSVDDEYTTKKAERRIGGVLIECTMRTANYRYSKYKIRADGHLVLEHEGYSTKYYKPGPWEMLLGEEDWPSTYRVDLNCPVCAAKHHIPVPKGELWIDHYSKGYECWTCNMTSPPDTYEGYSAASLLRAKMKAKERTVCGHCGGTYMVKTDGCSRCGKPQCCIGCCKLKLHKELE